MSSFSKKNVYGDENPHKEEDHERLKTTAPAGPSDYTTHLVGHATGP
jgi:hypothetical protein